MIDELLTLEEMAKLGGPYLENNGYFSPVACDTIVARTGSFITLCGEVSETVAKKIQREFPSSAVTAVEGKIQLYFPLTETLLCVTGKDQKEGEN